MTRCHRRRTKHWPKRHARRTIVVDACREVSLATHRPSVPLLTRDTNPAPAVTGVTLLNLHTRDLTKARDGAGAARARGVQQTNQDRSGAASDHPCGNSELNGPVAAAVDGTARIVGLIELPSTGQRSPTPSVHRNATVWRRRGSSMVHDHHGWTHPAHAASQRCALDTPYYSTALCAAGFRGLIAAHPPSTRMSARRTSRRWSRP